MKIAIVVGVSKGLGNALVHKLLQHEFHVIGLGRTSESFSGNYEFQKVDLTNPIEAAKSAESCFAKLQSLKPNQIDYIHNAAVASPIGLLHNLDMGEQTLSLNTNLLGPLFLAESFMRAVREIQTKKRMIFISSGAAVTALPGSNIYSIAKAGLEMIAKAIASESEHTKNDICSVAYRPGIIDTQMQTEMRSYPASVVPIVQLYKDFHAQKLLRSPADAASLLYDHIIASANLTSGQVYSVSDFVPQPKPI